MFFFYFEVDCNSEVEPSFILTMWSSDTVSGTWGGWAMLSSGLFIFYVFILIEGVLQHVSVLTTL